MQYITAKRSTWLKRDPIDSDHLAVAHKRACQEGQRFGIEQQLGTRDGHTQVRLASGAGDWWLFTDHWDLPTPADGAGIDGRWYDSRCVDLVCTYEGFREQAYRCPAGVWTIGYGATALDGVPVREGDRISEPQARTLLLHQLDWFASQVRSLVTVPVTKGMADALTSFAYNLGADALRGSTLLRYLNGGDYIAAAQEFARWKHANGQVLEGLVRRREAERQLFLCDGVPSGGAGLPSADLFSTPVFPSCHFTYGEVFQWDEKRITRDPLILHRIRQLAEHLEALRQVYGKPLGITSWYRDPATNARVNGASQSRHLLGDAADCYAVGGDIADFQAYCLQHWEGGVGRGARRGFVHLDLGPTRQWDY
jgi:GH24 family phage-related lysozyme (muramidase)